MPPKTKRQTRTSAKTEAEEHDEDIKPLKQSLVELDPQRVLYLPDEAVESLSSSTGLTVVRHPHPRTKTLVLLVVSQSKDKLFELNSHSTQEGFCSLLIDQTVEKDGKIYTVTPFDARFLVLDTLRNAGGFVEIADFFEAELACVLQNVNFEAIADHREVCERRLVRYNETKVLAWLEAKARRTAKFLASKNISCGAVAKSRILEVDNTENTEDYLQSAVSILREYISESLSTQLEKQLGLERKPQFKDTAQNDCDSSIEESKPKRRKIEEPTEDYTKGVKSPSAEKKPATKLTPAQKKLALCDKSGMKNIASFFGKKSA